MEESVFLKRPGDSLIIETRQNKDGLYEIVNPRFEFGGVISSEAYVIIYFRTVSNGIMITPWEKVGSQNTELSSLDLTYRIEKGQTLQIKFVRSNDIVDGDIEFIKFYTEGTYRLIGHDTPTLDASMFAGVNSDDSTTELETNLFKKLYFRSIVPNYIKRGDNRSMNEDRDYVSLFSAISRFFALIIKFFKRWENINNDEEMLKEILRNNGIQFNESTVTLSELKHLVQNLNNEISKRGTKEMFMFKGDKRADGTTVAIDGEFIRMIQAKRYTEILFEHVPKREIGWCIGNSSPIYRGISGNCFDLDKLHLKSHLFSSLKQASSLFPFIHDVVLGSGRSGLTGRSLLLSGEKVGIGRNLPGTDVVEYLVPVDACLDYEITMRFKVLSAEENSSLYAFVEGFNINRAKLIDAFVTPDRSSIVMSVTPNDDNREIVCGNFFKDDVSLNLKRFNTGVDYFVRFVIKSYASQSNNSYSLNIGMGNELHFNNPFVRYILPTFMITSGRIEIWGLHIRPLVRGTNINPIVGSEEERSFSTGFVQVSNLSHMYVRNGNTTMSEHGVEDFINRNMIPYNGTNIITFIK